MDDEKTVEVELPDGKRMMARVRQLDAAAPGGPQDVGLDRLLSFAPVSDALQGVGSVIAGSMEKIKPSRATVEFGLELGVKGGSLVSVFVDSGSKASLRITLEWERGAGGTGGRGSGADRTVDHESAAGRAGQDGNGAGNAGDQTTSG
ncbi:CU044_2847 family protein [Streptomyces sp. NPDC051940]|uniref:CU044_2847 family protein n=1 Tax=Streptomyces sp. NPDC051940 TaxID=3155675 RepID=UPI0034271CCF